MLSCIKKNRFYIVFFALVTLIACFFPPSWDDYGWATSRGEALLQKGFADYNGRYFGNFSAYALTRVPWILPFVKGFTMTGILILTDKFTKNEDKSFRTLEAALLLVPMGLFMQSFVWTAGFANYTLSLFVIMLCLWLLKCAHAAPACKKALLCPVIALLGVSGQLFMETFTVVTILIAFTLIAYYIKTEKRFDIPSAVFAISCIAGAMIMFSNGIYAKAFAGEDVYQKVALSSSVFSMLRSAVTAMLGDVSMGVIVACMPAVIAIMAMCIIAIKRGGVKPLPKALFYSFIMLMPVTGIVMVVVNSMGASLDSMKVFVGIQLILMLSACATAIIVCEPPQRLKRTGVYFLLIAVNSAPMCFVSPVGPRCFSAVSVLFIMIAKEMFDTVRELVPQRKASVRWPMRIFAFVVALDVICYSTVFFSNQQRINYVREQADSGVKVIEVEHTALHFMVYYLDSDNAKPEFMKRYCEYYGLPTDTIVVYK